MTTALSAVASKVAPLDQRMAIADLLLDQIRANAAATPPEPLPPPPKDPESRREHENGQGDKSLDDRFTETRAKVPSRRRRLSEDEQASLPTNYLPKEPLPPSICQYLRQLSHSTHGDIDAGSIHNDSGLELVAQLVRAVLQPIATWVASQSQVAEGIKNESSADADAVVERVKGLLTGQLSKYCVQRIEKVRKVFASKKDKDSKEKGKDEAKKTEKQVPTPKPSCDTRELFLFLLKCRDALGVPCGTSESALVVCAAAEYLCAEVIELSYNHRRDRTAFTIDAGKPADETDEPSDKTEVPSGGKRLPSAICTMWPAWSGLRPFDVIHAVLGDEELDALWFKGFGQSQTRPLEGISTALCAYDDVPGVFARRLFFEHPCSAFFELFEEEQDFASMWDGVIRGGRVLEPEERTTFIANEKLLAAVAAATAADCAFHETWLWRALLQDNMWNEKDRLGYFEERHGRNFMVAHAEGCLAYGLLPEALESFSAAKQMRRLLPSPAMPVERPPVPRYSRRRMNAMTARRGCGGRAPRKQLSTAAKKPVPLFALPDREHTLALAEVHSLMGDKAAALAAFQVCADMSIQWPILTHTNNHLCNVYLPSGTPGRISNRTRGRHSPRC